MKLTGTQFRILQEALLSAFPTESSLKQLALRMDVRYEHIVGSGAKTIDATYALIQWAESQTATEALLRAARQENPGNEQLQGVSGQLAGGGVADFTRSDLDVALRVIDVADRAGQLGALIAAACTGARSLVKLEGALARDAAPASTDSQVRDELKKLAKEYDQTRATMEYSYARTAVLDSVVARMRTVASRAAPLLQELTTSDGAGDRLAAITILQEAPDPKWLGWLSTRVPPEETPFTYYYATLALRSAARLLDEGHLEAVRAAITKARSGLVSGHRLSERQVLDDAEAALAQRVQRVNRPPETKAPTEG